MPYSREHKAKTRRNILGSARRLFSEKGYDAVTVDEVMEYCSLTRGAFYAHFKSKAELYREALKYSAANSELIKEKPEDLSAKEWLDKLLDGYLSVEHVRGEEPCPLAFLATDIVSRDKAAKKAYAEAYKRMNEIIMGYADAETDCDEGDIVSLTSMIIGAVAISRTIEDRDAVENILASCKRQARLILGGT
jgi:AcrR family transcriptional regulator